MGGEKYLDYNRLLQIDKKKKVKPTQKKKQM